MTQIGAMMAQKRPQDGPKMAHHRPDSRCEDRREDGEKVQKCVDVAQKCSSAEKGQKIPLRALSGLHTRGSAENALTSRKNGPPAAPKGANIKVRKSPGAFLKGPGRGKQTEHKKKKQTTYDNIGRGAEKSPLGTLLGCSGGALGRSKARLGPLWGRSWGSLGPSLGHLEASRAH